MWPAIVGGLVAAGGSLLGGILGRHSDRSDARRSFDNSAAFSREAFEREKAFALQSWDLMNAYNTPAAQMGRFKAAGLNPYLIYGQQNTTSPIHVPSMASVTYPMANSGRHINSGVSGFLNGIGNAVSDYLGMEQQEKVQDQAFRMNEFKLQSSQALFKYQLEQMRLQNDVLRQKINGAGGFNRNGKSELEIAHEYNQKHPDWAYTDKHGPWFVNDNRSYYRSRDKNLYDYIVDMNDRGDLDTIKTILSFVPWGLGTAGTVGGAALALPKILTQSGRASNFYRALYNNFKFGRRAPGIKGFVSKLLDSIPARY